VTQASFILAGDGDVSYSLAMARARQLHCLAKTLYNSQKWYIRQQQLELDVPCSKWSTTYFQQLDKISLLAGYKPQAALKHLLINALLLTSLHVYANVVKQIKKPFLICVHLTFFEQMLQCFENTLKSQNINTTSKR
jgi:hypothetical protein